MSCIAPRLAILTLTLAVAATAMPTVAASRPSPAQMTPKQLAQDAQARRVIRRQCQAAIADYRLSPSQPPTRDLFAKVPACDTLMETMNILSLYYQRDNPAAQRAEPDERNEQSGQPAPYASTDRPNAGRPNSTRKPVGQPGSIY